MLQELVNAPFLSYISVVFKSYVALIVVITPFHAVFGFIERKLRELENEDV
jgi:hypothetical protein